jgi:hypothetical protein
MAYSAFKPAKNSNPNFPYSGRIAELAQDYRPYDTMKAFDDGLQDALAGRPLKELDRVEGQAYDRGSNVGRQVVMEQYRAKLVPRPGTL